MSPWSKTIFSFVFLVFFVYLLFGVFLYLSQRSLIYFPVAEIEHSFSTEQFAVNNVSISAVVVNEHSDRAIIYFGGNAEAVVGEAAAFSKVFPQHTLYLINYRGYAGSTGTPTESGLYADAIKIYDILSKRHQFISVIGRSLGSGVATYLASERKPERIVLVTPFDSIQRLAQEFYPLYPMSVMLKDKYDSIGRVDKIEAPVLVIVADDDYIIPRKNTQRLIDAFPPLQVRVHVIGRGGHNSVSTTDDYYEEIGRYLNEPQP